MAGCLKLIKVAVTALAQSTVYIITQLDFFLVAGCLKLIKVAVTALAQSTVTVPGTSRVLSPTRHCPRHQSDHVTHPSLSQAPVGSCHPPVTVPCTSRDLAPTCHCPRHQSGHVIRHCPRHQSQKTFNYPWSCHLSLPPAPVAGNIHLRNSSSNLRMDKVIQARSHLSSHI